MTILIPCATGVEAVVKRQLYMLGYGDCPALNGRIVVENCTWKDVARLNVFLRSGERVLVRLATFAATTFDMLFEGIAKIMLGELESALAEKGIRLSWSDEVLSLIARASYSRKFGARNMRRYIQKEIEDRLAEQIISNYSAPFTLARIGVDGEALTVSCM